MSSKIERNAARLIGAEIRSRRLRKGITEHALSLRMGCSQSQISRIERGLVTRKTDLMHRICVYLDVQIDLNDQEFERAISMLSSEGRNSESSRRLIIELAKYVESS